MHSTSKEDEKPPPRSLVTVLDKTLVNHLKCITVHPSNAAPAAARMGYVLFEEISLVLLVLIL